MSDPRTVTQMSNIAVWLDRLLWWLLPERLYRVGGLTMSAHDHSPSNLVRQLLDDRGDNPEVTGRICEQAAQEIKRLAGQRDELLAMVLKYASECGECNGTGLEPTLLPNGEWGPDQDCEACADIRELIGRIPHA